ncbi:hypothetical protein SKAU_G00392740 [Synaphobranchus kaupii]|uniref:Gypsy retrotransposon integrase-like protein 1 n=1 Tax=Synaphobranchus kaupii TaxID=118154 RepID=A0A9Q1EBV6_SYNKA|nr:hypothetical protein SKAU_G00392740 [Synaphobranchus kaupii]
MFCNPVKQLAQVFCDLFNRSLEEHIVPALWKSSIISPVPKKANPSAPNDFRPVASTPVIMKCFERLVLSQVQQSVQSIVDPLQFAYQQKRGVYDALLTLLHLVQSHLDTPKSYIRLVFVDFSSAFNTIQPHLMAKKLLKMNLNPHLILWVRNIEHALSRLTECTTRQVGALEAIKEDLGEKSWVEWQGTDQELGQVREWLQNGVEPTLEERQALKGTGRQLMGEWDRLEMQGGILLRRTLVRGGTEEVGAIVVPMSERRTLWARYHEVWGHARGVRLLRILQERRFWTGMARDNQSWARECARCVLRLAGPENHLRVRPGDWEGGGMTCGDGGNAAGGQVTGGPNIAANPVLGFWPVAVAIEQVHPDPPRNPVSEGVGVGPDPGEASGEGPMEGADSEASGEVNSATLGPRRSQRVNLGLWPTRYRE